MSADASLADFPRDTAAPGRSTDQREATGPSRRGGRVRAARPAAYSHSATGSGPGLGEVSGARLSPRIFAGLVRMGEFALLSGLGFLIAYIYVAEFFRQYAAAMALAGLVA